MDPQQTFIDFVERTQRSLRSYIAALGVPLYAVDEIAQDAYVTYFRQGERRPIHIEPETWIRGIARNHTLHFFRSNARNRVDMQRLVNHLAVVADEQEPDANGDRRSQALKCCIGKLPERMRMLLDWRYRDGLDTDEVARRMQTSRASIHVGLQRTREKLRECIRINLAVTP